MSAEKEVYHYSSGSDDEEEFVAAHESQDEEGSTPRISLGNVVAFGVQRDVNHAQVGRIIYRLLLISVNHTVAHL